VLPELVAEARRERREIRIWSAGCSTGEEAYSLAIVLAEVLGNENSWPDIRIFATDIDREAIAFARRGVYSQTALKSLPTGIRERYFVKSDGRFEIAKRLRALMVFGEHDLGERAPFPRIDLLLCRNVLIYFAAPMQQVALETFAFSLRPGGRLVLGTSETVMTLPEPFEEEDIRLRVYRRRPGNYAIPPLRPACSVREGTKNLYSTRPSEPRTRDARREVESSASADSLLLNLSVGVVVVDPRYYILRINSAARQMLGIHGTAFDQDFIHLAEALPPSAIRLAIDSAMSGKTSTAVYEVEPTEAASETPYFVEATIRPYRVDKRAPSRVSCSS
jgi:two-component system CheB/CheR fusion protein